MIDSRTQPIEASDAAARPDAARERVEQAADALPLTAGDQTIGVVLSAERYAALEHAEDLARIEISEQQIALGESRNGLEALADIKARIRKEFGV